MELCKEESGKGKQPPDATTVDMLWSDCLTTKLHPNTVMMLPGYWHNEYVKFYVDTSCDVCEKFILYTV